MKPWGTTEKRVKTRWKYCRYGKPCSHLFNLLSLGAPSLCDPETFLQSPRALKAQFENHWFAPFWSWLRVTHQTWATGGSLKKEKLWREMPAFWSIFVSNTCVRDLEVSGLAEPSLLLMSNVVCTLIWSLVVSPSVWHIYSACVWASTSMLGRLDLCRGDYWSTMSNGIPRH